MTSTMSHAELATLVLASVTMALVIGGLVALYHCLKELHRQVNNMGYRINEILKILRGQTEIPHFAYDDHLDDLRKSGEGLDNAG